MRGQHMAGVVADGGRGQARARFGVRREGRVRRRQQMRRARAAAHAMRGLDQPVMRAQAWRWRLSTSGQHAAERCEGEHEPEEARARPRRRLRDHSPAVP
jgi:hypothetical protein